MAKDQETPMLRLKNGTEVDARAAYVIWRMLEALQEKKPQECQSFAHLWCGTKPDLSATTLQALGNRHRYWFADDGTLSPMVREVLLNAYRDTPEGVVIVSPFQLANESERQVLLDIQTQDDLLLRRLRGRGRENPPGHSIR